MILVTGGSGLVGSHLISYLLKQGKHVRALYRNQPPSLINKNLEWIQGDILDVTDLEIALQGITHVYHCAAIVSFNPKEKQQLFHTNIEGTANVVNACIETGVEKLVYVSSVAALGRFNEAETVTETMKWSENNESSVYGKTKFLAEMEVWRGIGEGLNTVIVNPTIILGAGDWNKGSTGIFKTAYEEFPWFTNGVSGFVDVEDVVKVLVLLMESNISGERFILNGANIPYKDIFTKIALNFGKKPPNKEVSKTLASLVWRIEAIKGMITNKKPLLTKETAYTAQTKVNYNNTKLLKVLPEFTYTSIDTTLNRICKEIIQKYEL
jgi:dihydroflavonol-4-reductase